MGRQAFLTRLALGRSAYEPLAKEDTPKTEQAAPEDEAQGQQGSQEYAPEVLQPSIGKLPETDELIAKSWSYEQQYDKKGYPQNNSSKARKRRWRHAVNDVLATVGVCVAKGQISKPSFGVHEASQIQSVCMENGCGLYVVGADLIVRAVSVNWLTALRQRLQAFKFYSGIPLIEVVKSEWKNLGGLPFLFAGGPTSLLCFILDRAIEFSTEDAAEALKRATDGYFKPGTRADRLKDTALECTATLTRLALYALLTPLEVYSTLQRLDLVSAWPPIPYPHAYISGLSAIYAQSQGFVPINSLICASLVYFWIRQNNSIDSKVFQYVWAALPKPIRPDRFSLIGAGVGGLDRSNIPGLVDVNDPQFGWISATPTDHFAHDLQYIGRNWQVFYNRCLGILPLSIPGCPGWGWISSRPERRERAGRDLQSMDTLNQEDWNAFQILNLRNESSTRNLDMTAFMEERTARAVASENLHDPPNHFSPPSSTRAPSPFPSTTPGSQTHTNASSALPSPSTSPQDIELSSHNDNGEVHVNLIIPDPIRSTRYTTIAEGARRARAATGLPDGATESVHAALPTEAVWATEQPLNGNRPGQVFDTIENVSDHAGRYMPPPKYGLHHHVTTLSTHPAESMAHRVSSILMGVVCLPFEALFVRAVAVAFLSSPQASPASFAIAAKWKGEVYPVGSWGGGLSVGGWKGVGQYVSKMLLVQALEAGIGYVTWQVGMGAVWWIGKRWCAWGRPLKRVDSTQEPLRDWREWNEEED